MLQLRQHSGLRKVWGDCELLVLLVGLKEILANHLATPGRGSDTQPTVYMDSWELLTLTGDV